MAFCRFEILSPMMNCWSRLLLCCLTPLLLIKVWTRSSIKWMYFTIFARPFERPMTLIEIWLVPSSMPYLAGKIYGSWPMKQSYLHLLKIWLKSMRGQTNSSWSWSRLNYIPSSQERPWMLMTFRMMIVRIPTCRKKTSSETSKNLSSCKST